MLGERQGCASLCLCICVYIGACRHASFHAQTKGRQTSLLNQIYCLQPITNSTNYSCIEAWAKLGELSAGRRNSKCINMQKRCINCFISLRKLQYLNNIIPLLTSQYCAARTYFALRQLRSNKKKKSISVLKERKNWSTHLLIIRYTRPLTLAWLWGGRWKHKMKMGNELRERKENH